jgi:hypothetical protein
MRTTAGKAMTLSCRAAPGFFDRSTISIVYSPGKSRSHTSFRFFNVRLDLLFDSRCKAGARALQFGLTDAAKSALFSLPVSTECCFIFTIHVPMLGDHKALYGVLLMRFVENLTALKRL